MTTLTSARIGIFAVCLTASILTVPSSSHAGTPDGIRPFKIAVKEEVISDLQRRAERGDRGLVFDFPTSL